MRKFLFAAALAAMTLVSCNKDNGDGNNTTNPNLPEVNIKSASTTEIALSLSKKAEAAVEVELKAEGTLAAALTFEPKATIAVNRTSAKVSVTLDDAALEPGEYTATISIVSAKNANKGANATATVTYTKEEAVAPPTPAAVLTDETKACYFDAADCTAWYKFSGNKIALTDGYTVILHARPETLNGQQRLGNFGDTDESPCHMLRFGERGGKPAELELMIDNPTSSSRKKIYFDEVTSNTWHQFAIVVAADGSTISLYTDGNCSVENEAFAGKKAFNFAAFEFGNSWGKSYQSVFDGAYAYLSVWNRPLTADEIAAYNKTAPANDANGLMAFWPMTEGDGHVFHEATGKYEDIDLSKCTRCDDESSYVAKDLSSLIQWR